MHLPTVSQIMCVIRVQTMHGYIRIQKRLSYDRCCFHTADEDIL